MNQLKFDSIRYIASDYSWKFKQGHHTNTLKVVYNDGLKNVEVIWVKVNRVVTRN